MDFKNLKLDSEALAAVKKAAARKSPEFAEAPRKEYDIPWYWVEIASKKYGLTILVVSHEDHCKGAREYNPEASIVMLEEEAPELAALFKAQLPEEALKLIFQTMKEFCGTIEYVGEQFHVNEPESYPEPRVPELLSVAKKD